ncbi:hypothetical protein C5167_012008 [Papaver somniferum]|uniref:RNase H type-1 domain-containing protein n=1 Tax=Papaver somniferum TaxID=3469 RepID=A0A4Y7IZL3_PAPSO|nr:hypothetical protein C5167_012008 [Papaver somniferum]
MHVLFQCPFSRAVWSLIPGGSLALTGGYNTMAEMFESWLQHKQQQNFRESWFQLMLVTTWSLWNTRCEVNFQDVKIQPHSVVKKVLNFAAYLDKMYGSSLNQHNSTLPIPLIERHWQLPESPFFKLNCDASHNVNSGNIGIALILRDCAGTWRGAQQNAMQE